jgi:hypothetical protein
MATTTAPPRRPKPRAEVFCSKITNWTTSSLPKTSTKISRWSRSWPTSSRPTKFCLQRRKDRAQGLAGHPRAAEEGRRDGTDQRRCARGIRRLGHGQGFVRHHRRPHGQVRQLRRLHGRTRRHWHAAYRLLRHRRAEEEISAQAGLGRDDRRLCAVGGHQRLRRAELPHQGRALARRQALHPERREDVDHQRPLRRPVHRLRQSRWRKVHRVPHRERFPRLLGRRGRKEDGHSRLVHCAAHSERLQSAGGERARRRWQGPHHRLQHPERRPLQAGRRLRRRRAHLAAERDCLRERAQGVRQEHLRASD